MKVSIAQARAQLSKILKSARQGEEVIITDHNEPRFQLTLIQGNRALPPESNYDKFMESFRPISVKRGAKSSAQLIRDERDGE